MVEQGRFVRARMSIKRISASQRHAFGQLAVRLLIKRRKPARLPPVQAAPPPDPDRRHPAGNPGFP